MAEDENEVRVYLRDFKGSGLCPAGQRRWAEDLGLDFRDFARHGATVGFLRSLGDEQVEYGIRKALARHEASVADDGAGIPLADLTVTLADMRGTGYCTSGQRAFFAEHGLDYRSFARHGMPARDLAATGDSTVDVILANARRRQAREV